MLVQIVSHTPSWVFMLFAALLLLGLLQMRRRTQSLARTFSLPVVFVVLSCLGVTSAFGHAWPALLMWAVGLGGAMYRLSRLPIPTGNYYNPKNKTFTLPGSSVPLILMMTTFLIKYLVGAGTAMDASFTHLTIFPWVIGFLYGALSGSFAGRRLRLLKLVSSTKD